MECVAGMRALPLAGVLLLTACQPGVITEPGGGGADAGDVGFPDGGGVVPPGSADAALPGHADAAPELPPDASVPPESSAAAGVAIDRVSINQSVEIDVAEGGGAVGSRNATVVAGADALVGVFVDVEAGFTPRMITATVVVDGVAHTQTRMISADSGSNPKTSGFAVRVPGERVTESAQFYVELTEATPDASYPGSTAGSRYPSTGTAPVAAKSSNGPLKLVIVPFRYDADGSGRLPPTDAAAIQQYRDAFLAMYPVGEVDITVRAPVPYGSSIGATSSSQWGNWLDTLVDVRSSDGAASNVYYYGVAAPKSSFGAFCGGGCIAGLGYVPGSSDSFLFASVGVSFAGDVNVGTGLHEVGHTMGRSHSPCGGVSGADPSYPYSGAKIGVWGWDSIADSMKDPSVATDIMGYCNNQWISDYTYERIYNRIAAVNASAFAAIAGGGPQRYRVGLVDATGAVTWRRTMELDQAPVGGARRVDLLDRAGDELATVTGHFFPYDHLPGGMLLVPELAGGAPDRVRVEGIARDVAW